MNSIKDYIARLRTASPAEIIYRVEKILLIWRLKKSVKAGGGPLVPPVPGKASCHLPLLPAFDAACDRSLVDELLNGRVFGQHADPSRIRGFERRCRNIFFADIPPGVDDPDIRSVWEPARLQNLTILLFWMKDLPDQEACGRCMAYVARELLAWLGENSFPYGPHYLSPMECGLRIPIFYYCLNGIPDLAGRHQQRLIKAIWTHAWWISRRLSLHASLGNHTVCECVGLIFAGAVFQNTREGRQWLKRGNELLARELEHQVLPDGGPCEQSLSYHRFVLDLYWLAVGFLETNSLFDCGSWRPLLEKGEIFLRTFADVHGKLPGIGDSDDGAAIAPGIHPQRYLPRKPRQTVTVFGYTGYTVIRGVDDLLLTFDHGPLGMPPLYNHGHADALSVTLSYRGVPVFIDPGTYRYNGVPEWRRYFKSTRAHNTVAVDGLDQAHQATGFIWTQPYETRVENRREGDGRFSMTASHSGYRRLKAPVRHYRKLQYWAPDAFLIQDWFSGTGTHLYELNYHLGETRRIDTHGIWWRLRFDTFTVYLAVFGQGDMALVRGRTHPPFGWASSAYGAKTPAPVLSCKRSGQPDSVRFTTAVLIHGQNIPSGG